MICHAFTFKIVVVVRTYELMCISKMPGRLRHTLTWTLPQRTTIDRVGSILLERTLTSQSTNVIMTVVVKRIAIKTVVKASRVEIR